MSDNDVVSLLDALFSVQRLTLALVGLMIIETGILLYFFKDYMLDYPGAGELNALGTAEDYATKSLTFASLTFAGLTFLLAQFFQDGIQLIEEPVFLFTVGFGLFILSYKLEVFAATQRIRLSTQQRLFNFGVLFVVSGLVVFFSRISTQLMIPVAIIAVLVFGLHVAEFIGDYRSYGVEVKNEKKDEKEQRSLDEF
ncbi:hypothetical protein [Natronococcus roseus]|uniref:hypothetical protein n=1 Tax=Natronococcus roseus TaxID=1052014 RepID=UPI00374DF8F3